MGPGSGYGEQPRRAYDNGYARDNRRPDDYNRRPDYDRRPENRSSSYYGGSAAWYQSGVGLGKKDRHEHKSPNYRRHSSQYDRRTESEFARGYNAGYNGR